MHTSLDISILSNVRERYMWKGDWDDAGAGAIVEGGRGGQLA